MAATSVETSLRGSRLPTQKTYGSSSRPRACSSVFCSCGLIGTASTPWGTTRIRSVEIVEKATISSAAAWLGTMTRSARFLERGGEALTVETAAAAGERRRVQLRGGIVDGHDQPVPALGGTASDGAWTRSR